MKNIVGLFLISVLLFSCTKDEPLENEPQVENETETEIIQNGDFTGTLKCIDNHPLVGVEMTLTDVDGNQQTVTTDANGDFSFLELSEQAYTISFEDPSIYPYSDEEYVAAYEDLQDIVLGVRAMTNIDHLAYNLVNYEDGLTSFDMLFIEKLRTGDYQLEDIDFPWRYVFSHDINDNAAITDQLSFTYVEDVNLDITAIFIGDNSGIACQ